jgi:hypothetical protein
MSKFDKLFTKPATTATNNESFRRPNSFIVKEVITKANYDYKEEAFPDLALSNKSTVNTSATVTKIKKYSDIAATVNEVKKVEENSVPPGWTQFTRSKGNWKFEIAHGEKTKRQLELDEEEALLNNPAYIYNQMITTLSNNWSRYKKQYDSIHGEGAYDLIYYLDPVYPEDEYFSDGSGDYNNDNKNEYVNKYSQDIEAEAEVE